LFRVWGLGTQERLRERDGRVVCKKGERGGRERGEGREGEGGEVEEGGRRRRRMRRKRR